MKKLSFAIVFIGLFAFSGMSQTEIIETIQAPGTADMKFETAGTEKVRITQYGGVGIGTNNPTQPLQIGADWVFHGGGVKYIGRNVSYYPVSGVWENRALVSNQPSSLFAFDADGAFVFENTNNNTTAVDGVVTTQCRMRILPDGKVVIGDYNYISNPVLTSKVNNSAYKLYVEGAIIADKVKVATVPNWADYVFADDYCLLPLDEVKDYINKNHHLPNVPAAAEVEKEGIDMAAMDAKLMEKIEELTLYLIEIKAEVESLKIENEALKANLNSIKVEH